MTYDPHTQQQPTQPPASPYPQQPSPQQPTARHLDAYLGAILVAIGGFTIMAGSMMPWATARTMFGTLSIAGTEGDGQLFLLGGLVLVVIAIVTALSRRTWLGVLQAIAAVLAAMAAVSELLNVVGRLADESTRYVTVEPGIGLYVLALGGVLAAVGGFVHVNRNP